MQKLAVESADLLTASELLAACGKGWLSVVRFLHSRGVKDNGNGLDNAAREGHLAVCEELLAKGPPADEFHRLMASEGARLSSLIENVLDFARIEQGRKQYPFAETDITALVQDAVKVMTPQAEARGQKILTDPGPLPFVPRVDAGALQPALINLLDNALKFSPPGSEIRVTLAHDPSGRNPLHSLRPPVQIHCHAYFACAVLLLSCFTRSV